eukprot:s357_g33.t1
MTPGEGLIASVDDRTKHLPVDMPGHLRFPPRPVLIIIDLSSLSHLSRQYRHYAALNRDIYEHLTGYSEQAMWQLSKHFHPNALDTTRVDDLLNAISNRMMDQWQVVVPASTIQLHYEDDQAYDIILNPNHSIKGILSTCRPDWTRRQYDAFSSVMSPRAIGAEAMAGAAARALSLPPANPFWSEGARAEHALQLMRPAGLPDAGHDGPRMTMMTTRARSRSPGRDQHVRNPKTGRDRKRSSSSEGEPKRNSTKRGKGVGGDKGKEDQMSLERLLEREMVDTLKDENERLREELRRLRRSGTSSTDSWSEVTPQPPSAKDWMGRHEGQVKHVSERQGQGRGDGVCHDDRALHGMHGDLRQGHRAIGHGEQLERHRALMHRGHQHGHRAVHFHQDGHGRDLHQGDLQDAEH